MNKTLEYILGKYGVAFDGQQIIEIPNVGRGNIPEWTHELDFKIGVEVGVASGAFSRVICQNNPQMKIYGVDPWISYAGYKDYVLKSTFDTLESEAHKRLDEFPNYTFMKMMSTEAVKSFEDSSLDFVYLDANHEDPYFTEDVTIWTPKLKVGGIMSGHDYTKPKHARYDIIMAINKYVKDNKIAPLMILGTGKVKGMIRDSVRSWVFVKE